MDIKQNPSTTNVLIKKYKTQKAREPVQVPWSLGGRRGSRPSNEMFAQPNAEKMLNHQLIQSINLKPSKSGQFLHCLENKTKSEMKFCSEPWNAKLKKYPTVIEEFNYNALKNAK